MGVWELHLVVLCDQSVQLLAVHLESSLLQHQVHQVQRETQVPVQRPGHRGWHTHRHTQVRFKLEIIQAEEKVWEKAEENLKFRLFTVLWRKTIRRCSMSKNKIHICFLSVLTPLVHGESFVDCNRSSIWTTEKTLWWKPINRHHKEFQNQIYFWADTGFNLLFLKKINI